MSRIGHHRFPTPGIRLSVLNQDSDEISRKSDRNLIGTDQIRLDPILGLNLLGLMALPKFTGDPNQKVTQFINAVEHINSFAGLNESMLHSIAIIKLGGSAFS